MTGALGAVPSMVAVHVAGGMTCEGFDGLVSVAVSVCAPSDRPEMAQDHVEAPVTVVVHTVVPPSVTVRVLPAVPVPSRAKEGPIGLEGSGVVMVVTGSLYWMTTMPSPAAVTGALSPPRPIPATYWLFVAPPDAPPLVEFALPPAVVVPVTTGLTYPDPPPPEPGDPVLQPPPPPPKYPPPPPPAEKAARSQLKRKPMPPCQAAPLLAAGGLQPPPAAPPAVCVPPEPLVVSELNW